MKNNNAILIPADVPNSTRHEFIKNYSLITRDTGRLMLFACDQKIEHLNKDFFGETIHPDALQTEHLFAIASQGSIGAMATHLGLIARYGNLYTNIPYIVKLNAKTDLVATHQAEPISTLLWTVEDVLAFKQSSQLPICGIGLTIYIGSEYEHEMLAQAAQAIFKAHQHGLVTILWIYARGKSIHDDCNQDLLAGAAGLAASLGADFVKIKAPAQPSTLRVITMAAGNTKVICSGGEKKSPEQFLQATYEQLTIGGSSGCATGRNIFQHPLRTAVALTKALSALVFDQVNYDAALEIYNRHHAQ